MRIILSAILFIIPIASFTQINITYRERYALRNSIELGYALKNFMGDEWLDSLLNSSDELFFIIECNIQGEVKDIHTRYRPKNRRNNWMDDLQLKKFKEFLIDNGYLFGFHTAPDDGIEFKTMILQIASSGFIPTYPNSLLFPRALKVIFKDNEYLKKPSDFFNPQRPFIPIFMTYPNPLYRHKASFLLEKRSINYEIYNTALLYLAVFNLAGQFSLNQWIESCLHGENLFSLKVKLSDNGMVLKVYDFKTSKRNFENNAEFILQKISNYFKNHHTQFKRLPGKKTGIIELNFPGVLLTGHTEDYCGLFDYQCSVIEQYVANYGLDAIVP